MNVEAQARAGPLPGGVSQDRLAALVTVGRQAMS